MVRLGAKARLHGIQPELIVGLLILSDILDAHNVMMEVSHVADGVHARASIHYIGGAADLIFLGAVDASVKRAIFDDWATSVGQDFDVLFEAAGTANEHLHVEWQPKRSYTGV
jgi:hypothetical protein